jgi:hypothetical protein
MNSKRSAKRSGRSRDSQQKSERSLQEKSADSEYSNIIQEATERFRRPRPWLEAEPEDARRAAWCAIFPRSKFGKRQDDQLLRVIAVVKRDGPLTSAGFTEIARAVVDQVLVYQQTEVELKNMVSEMVSGTERSEYLRLLTRYWELRYRPQIDYPKSYSALYQAIADGLKYLETYRPTQSDFAIQALQEAFIGLMQSKYDWTKNGLPTMSEVTEMAKAQLERVGRSTTGWPKKRRLAGLGWLPRGHAGRPKKRELDANLKAKQEALSIISQQVDFDWTQVRDRLKAASGGKKLYERAEIERLKKNGEPRYSFEVDDEEAE